MKSPPPTSLIHAVRGKRLGAAAALLDAGVDVNLRSRLSADLRIFFPKRVRFETPLSTAIVNADIPMIELLLSKGAELSNLECEAAIGYLLFRGGKRERRAILSLLDHGLDPKIHISGHSFYGLAEKHDDLREKLESLGVKRPRRSQPRRKLAPVPEFLNASDFISFIHDWGHPAWIVLAVEAPLHTVSELYASIMGAPPPTKSVAIQPARKQDDSIAPLVAIAKIEGYKWSIILQTLCLPIDANDLQRADQTCQKLSEKLKTRAALFIGEDTSYSMAYTVYRNGNKESAHEWDDQNAPADPTFEDLGIYLPACYPRQEKRKTWLCVAAQNKLPIEQADIINITS